jgi:hypothetical protein
VLLCGLTKKLRHNRPKIKEQQIFLTSLSPRYQPPSAPSPVRSLSFIAAVTYAISKAQYIVNLPAACKFRAVFLIGNMLPICQPVIMPASITYTNHNRTHVSDLPHAYLHAFQLLPDSFGSRQD